jgi:Domain of unknown function (DUF4434)
MKYLLILLMSFNLFASECEKGSISSIFYQPLTKDLSVVDWEVNFQKMNEERIDTLILQWSRYGSKNFLEEKNWLENILNKAKKYKVKVVVGLYGDENYFKTLENTSTNKKSYLEELKEINIAQAKSINEIAKNYSSFYGWYVYDEINDKAFRSHKNQEYLRDYLIELATSLDSINTKPLYLSGYFTMQMDPVDFAVMFAFITQYKYTVLLQSGIGAGLVNEYESQIYMNEFRKNYKLDFFPIAESFKIEDSKTKKISKKLLCKQVQMLQKSTQKQSVSVFSLRYFFDTNI